MLSHWSIFERLIVAAALGSFVGFERERLLWAAGIRTHMLVCVGACLFMIVSAYGFEGVRAAEHIALDPSRIAAQVVSGIGFLGAGAILARGETVRGLTTAASIWTVAAIGLATGGGLYFAALASTGVIIAILAGVKPLEEAYLARNQSFRLTIVAAHGALTPELIRRTLAIRPGQVKRFIVGRRDTQTDTVNVLLARMSPQQMAASTTKLKDLAGVEEVAITARGQPG